MSTAPKRALASRRRFLNGLLALTVVSASTGIAAAASVAVSRQRGGGASNVRDHGAIGDASHDDTAAFQAAINALPKSGGTVSVPAGTYLIDPTRSVRLRSRMHLELANGARLLAMANAQPRAYVLLAERLEDVEISGGSIIGDRDRHLATTGEWGHGIRIRGCTRVTVRDIRITRCWGDAISAGGLMSRGRPTQPGSDYLFENVVCAGNRRQGLTIGSSKRVRIRGCTFVDTGGTPPSAGIDIEPDTGIATDIIIEDCLMRGNRGPGISLYKRVADVTIRKCTIEDNRGDGILAVNAIDCVFSDNTIRGNRLRAINVKAASRNIRIADNHFGADQQGRDSKTPVRVSSDSEGIRIETGNPSQSAG